MLRQHLAYAWRSLKKNPGFSLVAVLTLALGIGANAALFSVIDAVLLHPLPFAGADRVFRVDRVYASGALGGVSALGLPPTLPWESIPDIEDIERQAHTFSGFAARNLTGELTLTGGGEPRGVLAASVTPNFFSVLGFEPILGRGFSDEEAQRQYPVVVLTHQFWLRQYGGNADVVGRTIQLEHQSYRILGVLPPHLLVLDPAVGVLMPLSFAALPPLLESNRAIHGTFLFGRLAPGVTKGQAEAEIHLIGDRLRRANPKPDAGQNLTLVGLRDVIAGWVRPALLLLMGAVGLVLLIACANLGGMLLARAADRQRELAVRLVLGASRADIARQLLAEALLLAALGCAAGLLLAHWALSSLVALAPVDLPAAAAIGLNPVVLGFAVLVSLLAAVVCGTAPALQLRAGRLARSLNERAATGRREAARARSVITVAETALAVVLVLAAGLLVRSFAQLYSQDPGFRTRGLLTFAVTLDAAHRNPAQIGLLIQNARQELRGLPGVIDAGATTDLPLDRGSDVGFIIAGRPLPTSMADLPDALVRIVSPGYLQAAGLRLASGRFISAADSPASAPVAIVNRALARRFFPGQNPLEQHVELGAPIIPGFTDVGERAVVGVLADAHTVSLNVSDQPTIYVPFAQLSPSVATLVYGGFFMAVSTNLNPAAMRAAVTAAMRRAAPGMPISDFQTASQMIAADVAPQRFNLVLLSIFAALGMFLAAIGIYGVMAYAVTQRRAEIGIRIALGAQRGDILRLILGGGLKLAVLGLVIGGVAAFFLGGALRSFLYHVSLADPWTLAAVAVLFIGVAVIATLVPSLRAVAVPPAEVLRSE